jgi:hypothetical protein
MSEKDNKNRLEEENFTYQINKNNTVFIYWHGKHIKTLSGKASERFLSKIQSADSRGKQLILAKETGNFKRGNEKD